jgi:hypothetical protein
MGEKNGKKSTRKKKRGFEKVRENSTGKKYGKKVFRSRD